MTAVIEARDAYKAARELTTKRRLELGRAIREARLQKVPQEQIAKELELTREQIRRYQREYEKSLAGS
jgi:CRISPR/Cas system-associated protein Cas10 (large subunit of type III CRISPR-Cas system)